MAHGSEDLNTLAPTAPDGAWLFAQECQFVAGADSVERLPPPGLPEVAFAGRSNVGKSSLLNALTGRKHLARVSNTPGRTQQINFFQLGRQLMLVDLPGHGYAKVSKSKVKGWTKLTEAFIRGRPNLQRVLLLVDAKVGLKDADEPLMDLMDEAGPKLILRRDSVMNDLRIGYGFDAWTRRTLHEGRGGPNHSSSGHKFRSLRDERITVVASESDRIDFTVGPIG